MNASEHHRGFTLVELLVAAGITAFLASLMVTIVAQAAELWTRSAERLRCETIARSVFGQVESDLAAAIRREGSFSVQIVADRTAIPSAIWDTSGVRSKPDGPISLRTVDSLAESRFGVGGVWLRLLTTRLGQNRDLDSISAPVAIGYRIARYKRELNATAAGYLLCRSEVRAGASESTGPGTLEVGYDLVAAHHTRDDSMMPGDPGTITLPFLEGIDSAAIAEGVVDFGLRGYVEDASRIDGSRPLTLAEAASGSVQPDVVDVMLRILTANGIRRIAAFESSAGDATDAAWWALAEANSHVFTRRIAILSAAP